jgi:hypothetical protein
LDAASLREMRPSLFVSMELNVPPEALDDCGSDVELCPRDWPLCMEPLGEV